MFTPAYSPLKAGRRAVVEVGTTSTTHVPHRRCRAAAGRSRSQPVRSAGKCLPGCGCWSTSRNESIRSIAAKPSSSSSRTSHSGLGRSSVAGCSRDSARAGRRHGRKSRCVHARVRAAARIQWDRLHSLEAAFPDGGFPPIVGVPGASSGGLPTATACSPSSAKPRRRRHDRHDRVDEQPERSRRH
jgi:hypothetical protein